MCVGGKSVFEYFDFKLVDSYSHTVQVSQQLKEEQQQRMTLTRPPGEGEGGGREGGEGEKEEGSKPGSSSADPPKRSDAHLSCPACMTTVCIDCQQ